MTTTTEAQAPILFETRPTTSGHAIGIATLNSPRTLNGLSLEMSLLLDKQLRQWADDPAIAMVVFLAAGEKAFCAGGDLHDLYHSMVKCHQAGKTGVLDNTHVAEFFEVEYRLDYLIHTYSKPILCWGHGIVMGGGLGLMAGASHRIVTERSMLAFPEISIGLFPDVGGSWLMNRVPRNGGLFMALTGARIGPGDAIYAKLADSHVLHDKRDELLDALQEVAWNAEEAHQQLDAVVEMFSLPADAGDLQQHADQIEEICQGDDLNAIIAAIVGVDASSDAWLNATQKLLAGGAPGSVRLAFELHKRAKTMSLADTFRMECVVAMHCGAHGDLEEGIRALLIDKDKNPHWHPDNLCEADAAWAGTFLTEPEWPNGKHPLADLDDHLLSLS